MKTLLKIIAVAITAGLFFLATGCTGPMLTQEGGRPRIEAGFQWRIGNAPGDPVLMPVQFEEIDPSTLQPVPANGEVDLSASRPAEKMATWKKWAIGLVGAFAVSEFTGTTSFIEDAFGSDSKPAQPKPRVNTFSAKDGGKITVKDADDDSFRFHTFESSGPGSEVIIDYSAGE